MATFYYFLLAVGLSWHFLKVEGSYGLCSNVHNNARLCHELESLNLSYDMYERILKLTLRGYSLSEAISIIPDNSAVQFSNGYSNFELIKAAVVPNVLANCSKGCPKECSTCQLTATNASQCVPKAGNCLISGVCVSAGAVSNDWPCLSCIPSLNLFDWSVNPQCLASPQQCASPLFLSSTVCPVQIQAAFYYNPDAAVVSLYNFGTCQDDYTVYNRSCQEGFFYDPSSGRAKACW